jgi:hypothetical protein
MNMIGKKINGIKNENNCEKQGLKLNDEGDLYKEREVWNCNEGNL